MGRRLQTATHDFNATKTGPGRDLIAEYVEALRAAGLKVGFYYPGEELIVSKITPGIVSATLLTTGESLQVEPISNSRMRISGLPADPPDALAPVIKAELEAPPQALTEYGAEWLDGRFEAC